MQTKTLLLISFLFSALSIQANHTPPPTPSSKIHTCYIQSKTGDKCLHQLGAVKDPNHLGQYTLYPCVDATNVHFSLVESQREKGYYFIRDEHSKRCVHQFGANDAKLITQHACVEGHANLLWKLLPDKEGTFYLQAKHSGKCLYADPSGAIVQMSCDTGPGALWRFTRAHSYFSSATTVDPLHSCLSPPLPPNSDL